ncbi:ADP-ribosylglycohydrolase family protein [Spirosoma foliorum]|uniref:ADP-ribosylglycohydrolase family protein n=1 Tax=Spirosoma foliorum TaxID=2710596 RepID=A0A7G5GNC9_9BACT|nr:ADP-ribosylglycohydrolase family protein [Spirosoma foliorum]QMW00371.1 ADP-ribosylglycohydrolase family protein [Spirosoma foliorum]
MEDQIKGAFFGAAVGDALGVPVEFKSRSSLSNNPVQDYIGYGTWNQPPGTFSDDSSMLFCTAESLCHGFDLTDIANRFVRWYCFGYWSAHGTVFDIGNATSGAIDRLMNGTSPLISGGMSETNNGNGSLMRILPMAFYTQSEPDIAIRYDLIKQVSGITHYHLRSILACFIYTEFAIGLLKQLDKSAAYERMQELVNQFIEQQSFSNREVSLFNRILHNDISQLDENNIRSSGYVLDTLESSLWCFTASSSYSECVLKAVNLGEDTDTTATVAGGLAGLFYGYQAIPVHWIQGVAKREEIEDLAQRFALRCS